MNGEEGTKKKRGFAYTRLAVVLALMLAIGFVGGMSVNATDTSRVLSAVPLLGDGLNPTPDNSADLAAFWKAWNALDAKFVETHASTTRPSIENRIWGAIQGLAGSYEDPYTVFMPPSEAKVFQEDISGNFEGVGMEIGVKDGVLTVIAPLKGTPAESAGILAGDAILAIDSTPTEGLSSDEAVKLIRGPKGTVVTFRILRDGEFLDIGVTRDTIQIPTIDRSYDPSTGVYTISLYTFTANSSKLFTSALNDFRASGATRLLVDLRGNPGGYLEAAVSMASHFLPEGAEVVTEDYKGKRDNIVHRSRGINDVPKSVRVAILVDRGSASASEILAGALQDHDRAVLIGTRTFGKGSVQELVKIEGGALKVTVARWLTPAGQSISDGGLTPDFEVERTREQYLAGEDPQMDRAIEYLRTGA